MKRATIHPLRRDRQQNASDRQTKRDNRTDQEQLDLLRKRGHGHCGEAVTLANRLENN